MSNILHNGQLQIFVLNGINICGLLVECTFFLFDLRHPDLLPEIAENEVNSTSSTSICINRGRLHVSTLIGSSSDLLFKTSL